MRAGWKAYPLHHQIALRSVTQFTCWMALGVATVLFVGCVPSSRGQYIAPPTLPAPSVVAIADGGRDSLSQIVQLGADPAHQRVFILAGHQIFGPAVSAPWADRLVAVERTTGAPVWQMGTPSTGFGDRTHWLSGIVVDPRQGRIVLATSQQVLALRAADGTVATAVPLPAEVDCVSFPAPTEPPTLDARARALFACKQGTTTQTPVGVLVDFTARTTTVVLPPPYQGLPPPGAGVDGHVYVAAEDGLRVFAGAPQTGATPLAALPFDVVSLTTPLLVERTVEGNATGRVYLAGVGAQVAFLDDVVPAGAMSGGVLADTILAERAVALAVDPARFRGTSTLPTLPNFLVAPGQFAHTFCFGPTQPFTPGSVTTNTAVTPSPSSDGPVLVDLQISVRDTHDVVTGSRHWVVAVATDGTATIQTDQGNVDPFTPTPPVPCPV
jgi:outer membrane protein assembly factor BamB